MGKFTDWILRRNTGDWEPDDSDDGWSDVRTGHGRQKQGRITGAPRNKHMGADTFHQNRAGRRFYVKVNQTRNNRKNLIGFGRWRRHNESTDESWALQTATPVQQAPRAERRPHQIAAYRRARKLRLRSRLG